MNRPTIREAATRLENAVDQYIREAAQADCDVTAVAFVLSDRFGSFRFHVAAEAAQLRNTKENER